MIWFLRGKSKEMDLTIWWNSGKLSKSIGDSLVVIVNTVVFVVILSYKTNLDSFKTFQISQEMPHLFSLSTSSSIPCRSLPVPPYPEMFSTFTWHVDKQHTFSSSSIFFFLAMQTQASPHFFFFNQNNFIN